MTDLSDGRRFWLGGKVGWSWSDGTPWNYQNWAPEAPNGIYEGQVEDCLENLALAHGEDEKGMWNDRACNNTGHSDLGYVCKKFNRGETFWSIELIN